MHLCQPCFSFQEILLHIPNIASKDRHFGCQAPWLGLEQLKRVTYYYLWVPEPPSEVMHRNAHFLSPSSKRAQSQGCLW